MEQLSLVLIGSGPNRPELKRWLQQLSQVEIRGEIRDSSALRLLTKLDSEVVLLDCAAPEINALAVLPWIRQLPHAPMVIALGATGTPAEQRLLMELGAHTYIAPGSFAPIAKALEVERTALPAAA